MAAHGANVGTAEIHRLFGLSVEECEAIRAEGENLLRENLASRVTRHMDGGGRFSMTVRGYWGRHFTVVRERGDCLLIGLYGRVLARNRRFSVILDALRLYTKAAHSAAKP